ncbi:MAG: hypothetical protein Q7R52_03980 [archaeon]|nr:hypothetical protein [archaeon]
MNSFFVRSTAKMRKAIPLIEAKIKINIMLRGKKANIKGNHLNEVIVLKILQAIDFGFDVEDALLLKNSDYLLEFINIKEHTRRKNLQEVRSRVIGTSGKAKRTIEELSGAVIVIHDNKVGIIVNAEHLTSATQGIISLIQGSKHANVFAYLEKQNRNMRKRDSDDLGLKKDFELKEEDISVERKSSHKKL